MDDERDELLAKLEAHYRRAGLVVSPGAEAGTLEASGPGGTTWIGAAVLSCDAESPDTEQRLLRLADRRMPGGELCPIDLLAAPGASALLEETLGRLGLDHLRHISVYSLVESATVMNDTRAMPPESIQRIEPLEDGADHASRVEAVAGLLAIARVRAAHTADHLSEDGGQPHLVAALRAIETALEREGGWLAAQTLDSVQAPQQQFAV